MHEWQPLTVARHAEWSALALVAGENTGPSVSIHQCRACNSLRVTWEGPTQGAPRESVYGHEGRLVMAEPECARPVG